MQSQVANDQNAVNYVCLEKMTDQMGMHYSFAADPITYRCDVITQEEENRSAQNLQETQPYGIHIKDSNYTLPDNVVAYLKERELHPHLWTLRSFLPTPPPLPEKLPVEPYRRNLNYTHTDALIRSGQFKLFTRQWPAFLHEGEATEYSAISHPSGESFEKPKPSHFSRRRMQRIQKARQQSLTEPHTKENSTIEDIAEVFPAGVKALGVIENELGKLVHSKSLESHGEHLKLMAKSAENAAQQPPAKPEVGAAMM